MGLGRIIDLRYWQCVKCSFTSKKEIKECPACKDSGKIYTNQNN